MASTVVNEKVTAKVEEVSKRGKEGSYKVKVVKFNNKEYTVGKEDKDSVKVGQTYDFKLSKSEYNDKLYYWANLVKQEQSGDKAEEGGSEDQAFKNQVFAYLKALPKDKKIATINYILNTL